jgi:iron complex outermembrane receptor protein
VRAFASDEFRFPEQQLSLSLGLVALYNTFTGADLQPSVRVGWDSGELGYFWASGSQAVRVPSIEEQVLLGGLEQNESVISGEFGWRRSFGPSFSLDATLYYNDYRDVRFDGFDSGAGEPFIDNSGSGYARGGELAIDASPLPGWTLRGAYSYHWSEHGPVTPEGDLSLVDGQYPRHIFNLRSYADLGRGFELDLATYVAEDFEPEIGSDSWRSDLRLGWNPRPDLAWSLGVQSFHDARYLEFPFLEIRRVFYLQLSWTPGARASR